MKTISKYLPILLALIVFQNTQAQDGDAVFNKIIHEYTLHDNGSTEFREYKEVKLLSHMSFHRLYGETFIIFNPEFQEVVINDAYTIMADGKKVVVPDNAFNEVLPREASYAAPYNGLRELVITHTGLEVGATIYLDYTLMTRAGYVQTFMGEELINDIVPIGEKQVIVRIPADQELQYKVLNLRTSAELIQDRGMNIYTFSFRGLSAQTHEWGSDPELLPRLFFSAATDLDRAYFPFVSQPAFTYQANAEMVAAVQELKITNAEDLMLALAIQKMVVNDIATWNLPLEYAAFKCRTPEEVWNSNGGTVLEKNVLLATLFLKAGLAASPVAIIPEKYFDRKVGSLYIFKDFAVQAKGGKGERLYFSATHMSAQNPALSEAGHTFLLLDGAIESLRTFDAANEPSGIIYHGNFSNENNETLKGNLHVELSGSVNPYYNLAQDTAYAKRFCSGATDARLLSLNQNESIFDLEIENKAAFDVYGDYIFMHIPASSSGIDSWGYNYIEKGRQTSINLKELINEQYHYMISLPEGFTLVSPAVDLSIDNPIGMVRITLRQEGNILYSTREITLKKRLVQYNEFDAFNELWKAWMNPSMKQIVFKKP